MSQRREISGFVLLKRFFFFSVIFSQGMCKSVKYEDTKRLNQKHSHLNVTGMHSKETSLRVVEFVKCSLALL